MTEIFTTPEGRRRLKWCFVAVGIAVGAIVLFGSSTARAGQLSTGTVYLAHPKGCPATRFCACGAAVEIFGRPIRSLWPSTAWFKFPRTQPKPNTVAVRRGHVFVLKQHVQGNIWLAADYNSGKHKSRLHQRSIAGFTIVDPFQRVAGL